MLRVIRPSDFLVIDSSADIEVALLGGTTSAQIIVHLDERANQLALVARNAVLDLPFAVQRRIVGSG